MSRIRLLLVAVAALALLAPAPAQAKTRLNGTVGPSPTINLKSATGKRVTTLRKGVYVFVIQDRSGFHNFHLRGPGVNRMLTTVSFTGTKTVMLTLKAGKYTYFCDPHASSMRGTFTVR